MKNIEIYVVHAVRWGDINNHSYIAGVFNKKHAAKTFAEKHFQYRGGKYECRVEVCNLNQNDQDADHYTKIIERYKTDRYFGCQLTKENITV